MPEEEINNTESEDMVGRLLVFMWFWLLPFMGGDRVTEIVPAGQKGSAQLHKDGLVCGLSLPVLTSVVFYVCSQIKLPSNNF